MAAGLAIFSSSALAADLPQSDFVAPTQEELAYMGLIEIWGGWTFADGNDNNIDDDNHPAIGGSGRVSVPLAERFSGQIDIDGEANFLGGSDIDENYGHSFMAYGHLSWRDPQSYLFGIFGGLGASSAGEDEQANVFVVGAEAQAYFNSLTLYGQGGYFTTTSESGSPDGIENAFFVRGVGRYFLSNNSKLEGEVTFAIGDIDYDATADSTDPMWAWGARYEQMAGTSIPAAWFVGYRGSYAENQSDNTDYTDHTVMAGMRFHFGADSLMDNDRRGATLDSPWAIPRWVGYSLESID